MCQSAGVNRIVADHTTDFMITQHGVDGARLLLLQIQEGRCCQEGTVFVAEIADDGMSLASAP